MNAADPQSPSWVSRTGIAWALDEAPCPADLLPVLIAIARRAGNDGRGSWQSTSKIASQVGEDKETVRKKIRRLCEEKLIEPGDQSIIPPSVPSYLRPVVYDLVLGRVGPKPMRASRNPSGKKKTTEPDAPPRLEATPPLGSRGPAWKPDTPPLGSRGTPRLEAGQIRSEEEVKKPSLSDAASTADRQGSPPRERDSATPNPNPNPNPGRAHRALAAKGITGNEADMIINHHADKGPGWWKTVVDNGDLDGVISATRAALARNAVQPVDTKRCDSHRLTYTTPECPGCRGDRLAGTAPRLVPEGTRT